MPTDPKTGTESRFVMNTMFLFWKLTEIQKHLRDCSEDIVKFANFLAERLDFVEKPVMCPWDFVREWQKLIDFIHSEISNPLSPHEIWEPIKLAHWKSEQLQNFDQKMMPIFAEDLCGKEFAEVAKVFRDSILQKNVKRIQKFKETHERQSRFDLNLMMKSAQMLKALGFHAVVISEEAAKSSKGVAHELARLRELREETGMAIPNLCHPFPPGDPVLVEEGKRAIKNNALSGVERIPPPLGHEFGPHGEYC